LNSCVYKDTLLPTHPERFAFVRFIEDTLWPNHPVRFFSALSLEKNAPSDSTFSDFCLKRDFYNRRKLLSDPNYLVEARSHKPQKCRRRNTSSGQTTWRAGRREHWREAAVSGDRPGVA